MKKMYDSSQNVAKVDRYQSSHTHCIDFLKILRVVQYTQLESTRLWYLQLDKLEIDSWTLIHIVDLDFEGGLKMLSI